ncbi:GTPase IMAP family member 7-like [Arapaima gigas]
METEPRSAPHFILEELETNQLIRSMFGDSVWKYMIVLLFTHGDRMEGKTLNHIVQNGDEDLQRILTEKEREIARKERELEENDQGKELEKKEGICGGKGKKQQGNRQRINPAIQSSLLNTWVV